MEIKNFKEIGKGALKYVFTMVIPEWGGIEIDCAAFETNTGSHWVNFAAKEYTNKDGQKKSFNQVRWPKAIHDRLYKSLREKMMTEASKTKLPEVSFEQDESELPF